MNTEPEKYRAIISEIEETLPNANWEDELLHGQTALKWLLKLDPNADDDIKIASLAHDIDRAFPPEKTLHIEQVKEKDSYADYKRKHAERSGEIIAEILKQHDCSDEFIKRVKEFTEKHEEGGSIESDLVRDADSIAYFDAAIDWFFDQTGLENTKNKIDFMFDRASNKVREIIKGLEYKNPELREYIKGK